VFLPLFAVSLSVASGDFLVESHTKRNIKCISCHGTEQPTAGSTVESTVCLKCHGSYKTLAAKTFRKEDPKVNPHQSHLGEVGCDVCHHVHSASQIYCLECHKTFNLRFKSDRVKGSGK